MRSSRPVWIWLVGVAGCGVTSSGFPRDGGGIDQSTNFNFDFGTMVCSPADPPTCDGAAIKTCRTDGSGYDFTPCEVGCANGACTCNPGDARCNGPDVEKCDMNGAWQLAQTCGNGTQCQNGVCSDARCDDELMTTNPHALPSNAWPRFRHDNRNTGSTPTKVAAMPKMKWKTFIGGTTYGSNNGALASGPIVNQDNQIFIGGGEQDNMGGSYYSLDAKGNKLWTFAAQRGFGISTPAVRADATSYFSTTTQTLYAIDPMGKQVWNFHVMSVADGAPVITKDGNVIYSSDDGSVYALDFAGKLLWKSDPVTGPGEVDSGLAESCDGKIYAGGRNGWMQLDSATGKTVWKVAATNPYGECSPYVTADGTLYGFDSNGVGYAVDKNGMVIWMKAFGQPNGIGGFSVAKIGNRLFTVLGDGNLHAVDATNGNELWKMPVGQATNEVNAGPVTDGNQHIYYNSTDGNVYAFDVNGMQLWKIPSSGKSFKATWVGTMAIGNDGTLYVPGNDGTLYALQ